MINGPLCCDTPTITGATPSENRCRIWTQRGQCRRIGLSRAPGCATVAGFGINANNIAKSPSKHVPCTAWRYI